MTKAYRLPVLLIEFDRDRAFALQVLVTLSTHAANCSCCKLLMLQTLSTS